MNTLSRRLRFRTRLVLCDFFGHQPADPDAVSFAALNTCPRCGRFVQTSRRVVCVPVQSLNPRQG